MKEYYVFKPESQQQIFRIISKLSDYVPLHDPSEFHPNEFSEIAFPRDAGAKAKNANVIFVDHQEKAIFMSEGGKHNFQTSPNGIVKIVDSVDALLKTDNPLKCQVTITPLTCSSMEA